MDKGWSTFFYWQENFWKNLLMALLESLLKSYHTLVITLGIRPPTKLTLQMIMVQVLQ